MGGMFGGGGKKGGSTPAPDFTAAAEKQGLSSRPNVNNPFGSQTWTKDALGRDVSNLAFSGPMAGTMNDVQSAMGKAAAYDPTQARDQAITSNYNQAMSRLNPRLLQQQSQFNAGSANSGLEPGTEAYNNANLQLQQGQNDALQTAMAGAIEQGNRTQLTQMEQMRQPFNQAGSLMGLLTQTGNLGQPTNYMGAAGKQYEAGKDASSAQQAGKGGLLSGLGGLAGTAFGGPLGGMAGSGLGSLFGGGKGGTGGQDFDPNLGGYNF